MVKKTSPRGANPFRGIGKKAKARMKRGEGAKSAIKLPSRSSRKDPMEKVEAAAGVAQRALADLIAVGRAALAEGKEAWPDEVVTRLLDGENPVRVFREYRGISQTALAKAAKMNQGSLSAIESGTMPRADTLLRLSRTLGVSMETLLPR